VKLVVAPFDAPGCWGRVGSRRSDPATAIGAPRADIGYPTKGYALSNGIRPVISRARFETGLLLNSPRAMSIGSAPGSCSQELAPLAYQDTPLPIGFDKTISQPFIGLFPKCPRPTAASLLERPEGRLRRLQSRRSAHTEGLAEARTEAPAPGG
jgi:hypothetical protein